MKSNIMMYVLSGAWDTPYADGSKIVGISEDIEPLQKALKQIIDSRAGEYLEHPVEIAEEEIGERHYEIVDGDGRYAKFYITEHYVELSEASMGAISREMEKIDRTNDIKEYLRGLYESENLEPWKYEYINAKPEIMDTILVLFDKWESCNDTYNNTLGNAVGEFLMKLDLDDEKLEFLWELFGDVLIDDDECILDDFIGFECGTHREEVWSWFDRHYSKGLSALMFDK